MPKLTDHDKIHEKRFAETIKDIRWLDGKLQVKRFYKYERTCNGRYLGGGTTETWEDVPGIPPTTTDHIVDANKKHPSDT